jgi:hypothetical protein
LAGGGLPGAIKLGTKTPVATKMAGAKTNNNQLKAAAATVTKMVTMTATTTTMKKMAMAALAAARHWRPKRSNGG